MERVHPCNFDLLNILEAPSLETLAVSRRGPGSDAGEANHGWTPKSGLRLPVENLAIHEFLNVQTPVALHRATRGASSLALSVPLGLDSLELRRFVSDPVDPSLSPNLSTIRLLLPLETVKSLQDLWNQPNHVRLQKLYLRWHYAEATSSIEPSARDWLERNVGLDTRPVEPLSFMDVVNAMSRD